MADRWLQKSTVRSLTSGLVLISCMTQVFGFDSANSTPADESSRRSAAVALNYSRAALHHIRQNPSKRVLYEEQEKILNHLNLNGVADEEVLKLYSAVLDEIAQIEMADQEKVYLKDRYKHQVRSQLTIQSLNLMADLATANYVNAVRTGANSWWDYRNVSFNRDLDQWRVEKTRLTAVVSKSSQFLDTSWKMARAKNIPDRWLVRNDDLDKLEDAWKEQNPETRLRVLKRMEPFLECYPPYWYYVARTQQSLGQLTAAVETYRKLAELGSGHFRKDEMLASGLANQALIQAHLKHPDAADSARQALRNSTEVWEANLVCATILQQAGCAAEAEDAILRNLDSDLEASNSRIALLGHYCRTKDVDKLMAQLQNPHVQREVPAPVLLACASQLPDQRVAAAVIAPLAATLQATPRINLGRDDLVLIAGPNWQLQNAAVSVHWGQRTYDKARIATQKDSTLISFDGIGEFGSLTTHLPDKSGMSVTLKYPDLPPVTLNLAAHRADESSGFDLGFVKPGPRHPVFRLASFEPVSQPAAPVVAQPDRVPAKVISVEDPPADAMEDGELETPTINVKGK